MLLEKLSKYNIILGSASPRRKKLLEELGIKFSIKTTRKEEIFPDNLEKKEIAEFLAKQKSDFILKELSGNYLLITADTIVVQNNKILHKPKDKEDSIRILQDLSGSNHKVISGVCIKSEKKEITFSSVTEVSFNDLSDKEIIYYIDNFKPFDKAGSYGIQQWIGYIGIKKINGSYNNVVGLPTNELYQKLKLFI
jgi:septum formation protein